MCHFGIVGCNALGSRGVAHVALVHLQGGEMVVVGDGDFEHRQRVVVTTDILETCEIAVFEDFAARLLVGRTDVDVAGAYAAFGGGIHIVSRFFVEKSENHYKAEQCYYKSNDYQCVVDGVGQFC